MKKFKKKLSKNFNGAINDIDKMDEEIQTKFQSDRSRTSRAVKKRQGSIKFNSENLKNRESRNSTIFDHNKLISKNCSVSPKKFKISSNYYSSINLKLDKNHEKFQFRPSTNSLDNLNNKDKYIILKNPALAVY